MLETVQPQNTDSSAKRVLIIGRISTEQQNEENIAASYLYVEQHLAQICKGPTEITHLGERASGMLADRSTIRLAEQRIADRTVDVIIAEDLSRIFRNPRHQYVFVQNCVDADVRLVCLADHLDTADPNWEVMLATAAIRHGLFVPDTRRRVRRTATHSFHNGGMVLRVRYGYRKLTKEDAASGHFGSHGLRIAKVSECTPTIEQMCQWVEEGVSYVRMAERLNLAGIPPGPYSTQRRWSRGQVIDLLRDPILSGTRRFRVVQYDPVYGTGRHRRRRSPQPETKSYPELAHISLKEQQDVWRAMDARTEDWRPSSDRSSHRREVPRSRAYWPGQAVTCGICGGLMYDMGTFLKCRNALPAATDRCWNHVQVPIAVIRQKTVAWIRQQSLFVSSLRGELQRIISHERERSDLAATTDLVELDRMITGLELSQQNLTKAIARGGELEVLIQELSRVQKELEAARREKSERIRAKAPQNRVDRGDDGPENVQAEILSLLVSSHEFGDAFRGIVPLFRILPVQALDTPLVRPQAQVTVRYVGDSSAAGISAEGGFSGELDLFEPPVHIRFRRECVAIRTAEPELSLKKVAARLGIGHMTAKRALSYDRRMQAAGLSVPYRRLIEPPQQASRWHRRVNAACGD